MLHHYPSKEAKKLYQEFMSETDSEKKHEKREAYEGRLRADRRVFLLQLDSPIIQVKIYHEWADGEITQEKLGIYGFVDTMSATLVRMIHLHGVEAEVKPLKNFSGYLVSRKEAGV